MNEPLAIKLRPQKLDDVINQKHLIGDNKILTNMVKKKKIVSMILYGESGIGKTSIAHAIVRELKLEHLFLNAVINNKNDFNEAIIMARSKKGLIILIDEFHRLNKDKQDLLLPHLESGLITLIGMTTANPYHSINSAIRSRIQMFKLTPLTNANIKEALIKASKSDYLKGININEQVIDYISKVAGNDLRMAYNVLELAYCSSSNNIIELENIKNIIDQPFLYHNEDNKYNLLSAFQKSIRGSDVNAAIFYLAKLLELGDLDNICRRLTVITYEDIGLANPSLGPKVESAINASLRVGMPEAQIPLSAIVIELALSPKSNSAYLAIQRARNDVKMNKGHIIPNHLINHSNSYLYPHEYKFGYVKQQYLPDDIKDQIYYFPKTTSKYEQQLKIFYDNIKKLK